MTENNDYIYLKLGDVKKNKVEAVKAILADLMTSLSVRTGTAEHLNKTKMIINRANTVIVRTSGECHLYRGAFKNQSDDAVLSLFKVIRYSDGRFYIAPPQQTEQEDIFIDLDLLTQFLYGGGYR